MITLHSHVSQWMRLCLSHLPPDSPNPSAPRPLEPILWSHKWLLASFCGGRISLQVWWSRNPTDRPGLNAPEKLARYLAGLKCLDVVVA